MSVKLSKPKEDGFRIEITGDKDTIRQMLHGFGPQRQSFFGHVGPWNRGSDFWSRVRPNFWDWCDRWDWGNHEGASESEAQKKIAELTNNPNISHDNHRQS